MKNIISLEELKKEMPWLGSDHAASKAEIVEALNRLYVEKGGKPAKPPRTSEEGAGGRPAEPAACPYCWEICTTSQLRSHLPECPERLAKDRRTYVAEMAEWRRLRSYLAKARMTPTDALAMLKRSNGDLRK